MSLPVWLPSGDNGYLKTGNANTYGILKAESWSLEVLAFFADYTWQITPHLRQILVTFYFQSLQLLWIPSPQTMYMNPFATKYKDLQSLCQFISENVTVLSILADMENSRINCLGVAPAF